MRRDYTHLRERLAWSVLYALVPLNLAALVFFIAAFFDMGGWQ